MREEYREKYVFNTNINPLLSLSLDISVLNAHVSFQTMDNIFQYEKDHLHSFEPFHIVSRQTDKR